MIRLTWWEMQELLEHLQQRKDIWVQSEDNVNLWMRTVRTWVAPPGASGDYSEDNEQEKPACAILFTPPADLKSPYRLYQLQTVALDWPEDYVTDYVQKLLQHWTPYGQRMGVMKFLEETLKHPAETAELSSIAIEALDWIDESTGKLLVDPEAVEAPDQGILYPDSIAPLIFPQVDDPTHIGTYLLNGGMGWVKLTYAGGQIRVQMSVRDRNIDGFGPLLDGYVRPKDGRVADTAHFLSGKGGRERDQRPGSSEEESAKLFSDEEMRAELARELAAAAEEQNGEQQTESGH